MKIYCDKCGSDITDVVNRRFEENKVGNIVCPHCEKAQKRYLSETDFLMYLAYQEVVYFVLSFVTSQVFLHFEIKNWMSLLFIAFLVVTYIATTRYKSALYRTGFIKNATMYKAQVEDQNRVSRSIRWQFLMFFALVITFFADTVAYWFFVSASLMVIASTIIKANLAARKEK